MKKVFAILFLCLLVFPLFLNLLNSQEVPPVLNPEQITKNVSAQFDYLTREWKTILLANPTIKTIDTFLQKINIVFVVLFGTSYSLSPFLFFTLLLWVAFLVVFYGIFKNFSTFKKWISFAISFLLVILMAQLKLIEKQANFLIWLIFGDKPIWLRIILAVVIIFVFVSLIIAVSKLGKYFKKKRKKQKEKENLMKVEAAAKASEPWVKELSKEGED